MPTCFPDALGLKDPALDDFAPVPPSLDESPPKGSRVRGTPASTILFAHNRVRPSSCSDTNNLMLCKWRKIWVSARQLIHIRKEFLDGLVIGESFEEVVSQFPRFFRVVIRLDGKDRLRTRRAEHQFAS